MYFISEAISQSIAKGKQSAERKQTPNKIKIHYCSYPTPLFCISEYITANMAKSFISYLDKPCSSGALASILQYLTNLAGKKKEKKKPNIIY